MRLGLFFITAACVSRVQAVGCNGEHTEVERFLSCLRCDNHPGGNCAAHASSITYLKMRMNLAVDVQACPKAGTIVMHKAVLLMPVENARMPVDQFWAGAS